MGAPIAWPFTVGLSSTVVIKTVAVVLKEMIRGVEVKLDVRPVAGKGWTWAYRVGESSASNQGELLDSKSQAFSEARSAALLYLTPKLQAP